VAPAPAAAHRAGEARDLPLADVAAGEQRREQDDRGRQEQHAGLEPRDVQHRAERDDRGDEQSDMQPASAHHGRREV